MRIRAIKPELKRIVSDDNYGITRDGQVINMVTGRTLKPYPRGKTGHLSVDLPSGRMYVHKLVAEAYLGQQKAGYEVRHLDNDPLNNSVENLAYGTRSQNVLDLRKKRTHCPHGHEYTEENSVYNRQGHRRCRECKRRYR